jgi:hypothetical protein
VPFENSVLRIIDIVMLAHIENKIIKIDVYAFLKKDTFLSLININESGIRQISEVTNAAGSNVFTYLFTCSHIFTCSQKKTNINQRHGKEIIRRN